MLKFNYTKTYKSIVIRVFTWLFRKPELKRLRANFDMFEDILEHAINQHKEGHKDKFMSKRWTIIFKALGNINRIKIIQMLFKGQSLYPRLVSFVVLP
jgi:hypothetical protein